MKITILTVGKLGRMVEAHLALDYASRATASGRALALGPVEILEVEARKPGKAAEAEVLRPQERDGGQREVAVQLLRDAALVEARLDVSGGNVEGLLRVALQGAEGLRRGDLGEGRGPEELVRGAAVEDEPLLVPLLVHEEGRDRRGPGGHAREDVAPDQRLEEADVHLVVGPYALVAVGPHRLEAPPLGDDGRVGQQVVVEGQQAASRRRVQHVHEGDALPSDRGQGDLARIVGLHSGAVARVVHAGSEELTESSLGVRR